MRFRKQPENIHATKSAQTNSSGGRLLRKNTFLLLWLYGALSGQCAEESAYPHLLQPPFSIAEIRHYRDGGTIGAIIKDTTGSTFSFCIDRRIDRPAAILYWGALYPTAASAQIITHRDMRFYSTIALLQQILSQHLSLPQQTLLRTYPGDALAPEKKGLFLVLRALEILQQQATTELTATNEAHPG
ncbi:MAG: hypothetical protein NC924_09995 [Candidatus Omnitrophica bacterium]|nr:hypothetical protein [Candidatus Omnitrophota bacterium]